MVLRYAMMLVALVLLWLISGCTSIDRGGDLHMYVAEAESFQGPPAEQCMSACILLAVSDGGCITRKHRLTFHGVQSASREGREQWEQYLAEQYGPALGAWYLETGRHGTYMLTGDVLIDQYGLKECAK